MGRPLYQHHKSIVFLFLYIYRIGSTGSSFHFSAVKYEIANTQHICVNMHENRIHVYILRNVLTFFYCVLYNLVAVQKLQLKLIN